MAPRGKKTAGNTPDNKKGRKRRREDSKSPAKEPSTSKVQTAPQSLPMKPVTLESPIKSPNDWKYYKTIQLGNGLRVLLISDILCSSHRSVERIRQNRNCIDLEILKFNRDVLGIPLPPESRDLANNSTKPEVVDPKHVTNCNCEDQTASVALCISAGSLDEPPEVLGLAHFCEHMIFCGSKKYPARSQFDLFVTGNGGFTNGQTHCDHTLFNFFVNQSHLEQTLDMFASFFIDPLMDMEFMLAERDTVDDEFNAKKGLDDEKRAHILMLAGKRGHPVCQFSWGNKETLRTDGEHAKRLHELLHQFYQQYYGSESMYLTIQASEKLEQLEKLVVKYFGEIPCSTVPKPVSNFELMPFDTKEFRRWYSMVPTQAFDLLYLTWEFPPEALRNYQAKPLAYIQRVLAHEGNGGIAHYLIAKNLISSMSCSFGESQHEKTKYSTLFSVSFHLINIEQDNLNMIIEAFFSYIKFMVAQGPQEWFFDELKRIRAMEFHYLDERNVKDNTSMLVHEMQKRGPAECIIGDILMSKWEPALIQEYTKMLVPDKANYMLLSQADSVQKCCTKTEPYFGTEYHVRDIPGKLMKTWKNAKLLNKFSFFKPNPFLTTNFCLITDAASYFVPEKLNLDCDVGKKDKVKYSDLIEMWHLLDANDAEAEYRLLLMTPTHLPDVRCSSSLSLWAGILGRLLRPRLYGATEAKLTYSVGRCHYGIRTEIQGFSQNLHLLIKEILTGIAELHATVKEKDGLFKSEKSVMSQRLKNEFSNHELLEKQLRSRVMLNTCYTSLEMHNALHYVDRESFLEFCQNILKRMYCIGIATGNVSEKTAKNTASAILKAIKYKPLDEESRPLIQATELPLGETILRVRSLDRNGTCSTISVIYQIGHVSLRSCLIGQVIMETMTEHAFQELRVEKSLGYKVEVGVDVNIASNLAVFIKVTSQSAEFTGSYVVEKIDEFLLDFYKTRIEPMTESEFKKLKEDYGYTIRESKTVFKEIIKQEYVFDRQRAEERVMPRIQLAEFKTWYEQYLIPSCEKSKMRKLVIQVVGSGDDEYPVKIVQNWGTETCTNEPNEPKLTLLVPENASSHHIQDIVQFHASLPVLPKHKML